MVNADIGDLIRLERQEEDKTRTILLKIRNAYQRQMILLSARKLKTFGKPVFLRRQLTKEEADLENQALMGRRELINGGTEPKNLRVHDGNLFIRQGTKWIKRKTSFWLSTFLNILIYNARSIFEYDRGTSFSNAIPVVNHSQIFCLTETWLIESVKDSATFLANYTIHRKDRPSAKGARKHGGALIAVAQNIPSCEIVSSFKECVVIRLLTNKPIIICCLYSAPRNSHYTWSVADFAQLLTFLRSKQYEYGAVCSYNAGDINLTCTHWPSMTST